MLYVASLDASFVNIAIYIEVAYFGGDSMASSRFHHEVELYGLPGPHGHAKQIQLRLFKIGSDGSENQLQKLTLPRERAGAPVRIKPFERTLNALPDGDSASGNAAFAADMLVFSLLSRNKSSSMFKEYARARLDLAPLLAQCSAVGERCSANLTVHWEAVPTAAAIPAASHASHSKAWATSALATITRLADYEVAKSGSSAAFSMRRASFSSKAAAGQFADLARRSVKSLSRPSWMGGRARYHWRCGICATSALLQSRLVAIARLYFMLLALHLVYNAQCDFQRRP